MNNEAVLAVLTDSETEAKSLKEIAEALGIDIIKYADWIRVSRNLARVLRILIKWGWVARARRQRTDGNKFWHNVYWRTELAVQQIDKR